MFVQTASLTVAIFAVKIRCAHSCLLLAAADYPVDPNWWDDASCGIYDEILQIISSGKAARLNCSLCADDECRPLPPPSPLCEPEMETLCGVNRTVSTIAECKRCISLNAANLSHNFGCSSSDLQGFCPVNLVCPPVLDYYCGAVKPATTNTTGWQTVAAILFCRVGCGWLCNL